MTITQAKVKRSWGTSGSADAMEQLVAAFNLLVTRFDGLAAKLDADATVTDTNYRALHADANVTQLSTFES